jgi:hypothetical protein
MKKIIKIPVNATLGIATEVLYALVILLVAFLICLALSFLKI